MKINTETADAYLNRESLDRFSRSYIYVRQTDMGEKNIFRYPSDDENLHRIVLRIKNEIEDHAKTFVPCNVEIWDALFDTSWHDFIDEATLHLVVGCREPYDAFVVRDKNEKYHMVFDLVRFAQYVGAISLCEAAQNLLTHELFHIMLGKRYPDIETVQNQGAYTDKLDAIAFNEGFAHLVSYECREIGTVPYNEEKLNDVYERAANKMLSALREKDSNKQKQYIEDADVGRFYDKYACMCGMIYLGKQWQTGGTPRIKQLFERGWRGFATKSTEALYPVE